MDKKRVRILRVGILVAVFAIAVRLFYIQIIQHDEYVAKAEEAHISENIIPAERGKIYAMDGQNVVPIVLNETVYSVIFDPMVVDKEKTKEVLMEHAKDKMVVDFDEIFEDKELRYLVVARDVDYMSAKKIEEAGLSGVSFEKKTKRVYVEGEMASEVLGFVNADGEGQYGIELALEDTLDGVDGSLKSVRDVNGVALSIGDNNIKTPAVDGEDVALTIDRNIQTRVEQILSEHVKETKIATNASAVVLNPQNGEVLAMANVPNYNPADFGNVSDASAYQNAVLEQAYETASVCKTFTFATAIDLGVMNAGTVYNNTGSMTVDELKFENAYKGLYGDITMQQAFNFSLNTGSATALALIGGGNFNEAGREKLYEYLSKFGLGNYTGIELMEVPGLVPKPNEYDYAMNFTYANMTFGQGMNLTMMQVASAVAGIINDGKYYQPTIVKGKMQNGELVEAEKKEAKQVVKKETSEAMRGMLYGTRDGKRQGGIDKSGYYIGGKTGTGQVVLENGKYSDAQGETIASYVGFGGTEGELPEYVVMVKIWGDGQHLEGEQHATPIFNDISNYLIDYLKIPPKM